MSNASAPLRSLGDSLDSLRQRIKPTDDRKMRVLRAELTSYSLASSLENDVSRNVIDDIIETTNAVASLNPSDKDLFEVVMDRVERLLLSLEAG